MVTIDDLSIGDTVVLAHTLEGGGTYGVPVWYLGRTGVVTSKYSHATVGLDMESRPGTGQARYYPIVPVLMLDRPEGPW